MTDKARHQFSKLNPWARENGEVTVVIETPKGSRNKYGFDEKTGVFMLKGLLPEVAYREWGNPERSVLL